MKFDIAGRERVDCLSDAISLAWDYGNRTRDLVVKATSVFSSIRKSMYPEEENAPETFNDLVESFGAEGDPLGEFSREQTICGAETVRSLAMGHGVQGDLNKVTSEFPKGPDGVEVDLRPLQPRARKLAEQLSQMLERQACTLDTPAAPSS